MKIKITFPDGNVKEFPSGVTGMQIAESISPRLAQVALGIYVNEKPYDLATPITEDAAVHIVKWESDEGRSIFWHSSAHLMAEAIESIYPGTRFGIGPPIENGFYYDMDIADGHVLTPDDLEVVEKKMTELAKQDNRFERMPIAWEDAVAYFREKGDE